MSKQLQIQLIKSSIACNPVHVKTLRSLGLKRMRQVVIQPNIPSVQGKLAQINYLLKIEEV